MTPIHSAPASGMNIVASNNVCIESKAQLSRDYFKTAPTAGQINNVMISTTTPHSMAKA